MTFAQLSKQTLGTTVTWPEFLVLLDQASTVHVCFYAWDLAATDPLERRLGRAMEIPKQCAKDRAEWAVKQHGANESVNVSAAGGTLYFGSY